VPSSPGISAEEIASELTTLGYIDRTLGSTATNQSTLVHVQRTRFVYDVDNRLQFAVDALGDVSENVYDNAGNVIQTTRYATAISLPIATADPDRLTASDLRAVVNAANAANPVTHFAYDAAGRLRFTVRVLTA